MDQITLPNAIRNGSALTQKGTVEFFRPDPTDPTICYADTFAAAYVGLCRHRDPTTSLAWAEWIVQSDRHFAKFLCLEWPVLERFVTEEIEDLPEPLKFKFRLRSGITLYEAVSHLNDETDWTREAIAEWIERITPLLPPREPVGEWLDKYMTHKPKPPTVPHNHLFYPEA